MTDTVTLEQAGTILFKHIFTIAPEAVALFNFGDLGGDFYATPKFLAHATKVVKTVAVAVDGLSDVPALLPVLAGLGKRHVGYGVLPPHYDVVGRSLILTLGDALGDKLTPEVTAAWIAIYDIIKTTMMGDHYPEKVAKDTTTCC